MKRTVTGMLREAAANFKNLPYLLDKTDSGYISTSFSQADEFSDYLASELINQGFKKDDKIAILSEGRVNWVVGEFGILKAGCISVPLSIKLLPEEILFRLNHSESKAILVSHNTFEKVASIWDKLVQSKLKLIYLDSDIDKIEKECAEFGIDINLDILPYNEMIAHGRRSFTQNEPILSKLQETIEEEQVVNICYTSGTTGNPKGIMLTHLNYFSNSQDAIKIFNVQARDRLLIILPLDHSFAHTVGTYASLIRGLAIYFVDARGGGINAIKNIPVNMKEGNPHFMLTVPSLSGNFMNKIKEGIKAKGSFIEWLFNTGLSSGIKLNKNGYRKSSFIEKVVHYIPHKVASVLIFKKVRKIFGDSLRYCVGGGALLDVKQQHFFYSLGMPVYQGYGLTEATPIISANTPAIHKMGSSGRILPSITCKIINSSTSEECEIGETGEIVIKGDNVMKGYFKNPEATKSTLKNGWLYTGDLGYMDKDNFLVVVGREKALLISHDGEKYSPEEIEEAIVNSSELIEQAMIYNDHEKYTTALVTINGLAIDSHIKKNKITDDEILMKEIQRSFYQFKQEAAYINKFPEKWIPSAFRIINEPFSEQNKMINSTLKMVRYKIIEAYKEVIEDMYSPNGNKIICRMNKMSVKKYLPFT